MLLLLVVVRFILFSGDEILGFLRTGHNFEVFTAVLRIPIF
jgi:hypothetical protein